MNNRSIFRYANVYRIQVKCETPLHVGSSESENGEVLVHPVSGRPFLQASGIAGACRDYAEKYFPDKCADWFGDSNGRRLVSRSDDDLRSRLVFTDGSFTEFKLELRTRVKINPESGTTDNGNGGSGQLLETEYVAAGSVAEFTVYEYYKEEKEERILEKIFSALDKGFILLGGQLSNGCGFVRITKADVIECDMKTAEGRKKWGNLNAAASRNCLNEIQAYDMTDNSFIDFYMDMIFDQAVLVKGNKIDAELLSETMQYNFKEGERLPDKMQLFNGNRKFIIPGSSYKGVFRNHMESIMDYLKIGRESELDKAAFNDRSHLFFYDSCLDGGMNMQTRIHLDKFTGSVMDKALFKEAVNGGRQAKTCLHIRLLKQDIETDKKLAALVLLTMRDCAVGSVSVGSGYSVGRGFMNVLRIRVIDQDQTLVDYEVKSGVNIASEYVKECLTALQSEVKA